MRDRGSRAAGIGHFKGRASPSLFLLAGFLAAARPAAYLGGPSPVNGCRTDIQVERTREPIFNIPAVVVWLVAALCFIHVVVAFVLPADASETVLEWFAFDPSRYHATVPEPDGPLPGGLPAAVWTFVTYAFLHGSLTHLGFNLISLVAFGTPVARRFGTWRFLAFFAFTAATGALAHLVSYFGEEMPTIGASAAVLGMMAAAMRFVFQPGGPLGFLRLSEAETYRVPAKPLGAMLRDRRVILFTLAWFGLNALMAMPMFALPGVEGSIAWQAHIGGFVGGLLAFAAFDPVKAAAMPEDGLGPDAEPADDEPANR
jgi:membrane associated rhomboid family serine protease